MCDTPLRLTDYTKGHESGGLKGLTQEIRRRAEALSQERVLMKRDIYQEKVKTA